MEKHKSPVYNVIAVPVHKIKPNNYNPNCVAPPEMRLLYQSIKMDGYTMPILCWNTRIFLNVKGECFRYPLSISPLTSGWQAPSGTIGQEEAIMWI